MTQGLMTRGLSFGAAAQVMIAACDTFRSGAVEQLKTHCARLGVPLYERGYEKDPANVAYEAQRAAARASTDVLLVDTAGAAPASAGRPLPASHGPQPGRSALPRAHPPSSQVDATVDLRCPFRRM